MAEEDDELPGGLIIKKKQASNVSGQEHSFKKPTRISVPLDGSSTGSSLGLGADNTPKTFSNNYQRPLTGGLGAKREGDQTPRQR